ncbi:hypothetical protein PCANC_18434 [Puccinia coronata f. sp. avenae]|uniref:Uncharacterized protein n=1 Tax=Puccinia coronata f. sp. avenae TaxID=200324 RepID=A0A2N5SK69_9BASI|nr:hypothetical protein PCANC_18434 [Puccinia coronata f. sp. avenae]
MQKGLDPPGILELGAPPLVRSFASRTEPVDTAYDQLSQSMLSDQPSQSMLPYDQTLSDPAILRLDAGREKSFRITHCCSPNDHSLSNPDDKTQGFDSQEEP